jgi:hypothetical protein
LARIVADDDVTIDGKMGRPVLFGFGYRFLGRMGRVSRQTLSAARKRGLPLHDPVIAVAWALARRGKPHAARGVLEEFGYSNRFRVCRRTIMAIEQAPTAGLR